MYPTNSAESAQPFTISIIDPCEQDVSFIASDIIDQNYTITDNPLIYSAPLFQVEPAWCEITYEFGLSSGHPVSTCVSLNTAN